MDTVNKYAAESRKYIFDFSTVPEIVAGDTISSVGTVTYLPNDGGLTIGTTGITGSTATVVLSVGTVGNDYQVSLPITTSSGAIVVGVGNLALIG